jgi:hypothetical protein
MCRHRNHSSIRPISIVITEVYMPKTSTDKLSTREIADNRTACVIITGSRIIIQENHLKSQKYNVVREF